MTENNDGKAHLRISLMSIATQKRVVDRPDPIVLRVPTEKEHVLADDVKVPAGIVDLATFRIWAHSNDFPERGRIEYYNGTIFVDLSFEQLFDHNQVKGAIAASLYCLSRNLEIGRFFGSGIRVSMLAVDLSKQPDGTFVSFDSWRTGRVHEIAGRLRGEDELEGAPDMALEVVSDSSEGKDFTELPDQYYRAGVQEFWRADARKDVCVFEIFRARNDGFVLVDQKDGWQWSTVFGRWFRLLQSVDKLGNPLFELLANEEV
jgi:Uma2 family endonuclease